MWILDESYRSNPENAVFESELLLLPLDLVFRILKQF